MTHLEAGLTTVLAAIASIYVFWVLSRSANIKYEWMGLRRRSNALLEASALAAEDAKRLDDDGWYHEAMLLQARANIINAKLRRRPPSDPQRFELALIEMDVLLDVLRTDLDEFNSRLYTALVDEPAHDIDYL